MFLGSLSDGYVKYQPVESANKSTRARITVRIDAFFIYWFKKIYLTKLAYTRSGRWSETEPGLRFWFDYEAGDLAAAGRYIG